MPREELNISTPQRGLYQDTAKEGQPEGTYPYALNAVSSARSEGSNDSYSNTNERSTIEKAQISGIYLGHILRANNGFIIFSKEGEDDIISTIDREGNNYTEVVRTNVLSFQLDARISGVYRILRGCEEVIYFTDGVNEIRTFSITAPELFQEDGEYVSEAFSLVSNPNNPIIYDNIEVVSGGQLSKGSYAFLIQLQRSNGTFTQYLSPTDTIRIRDGRILNDSLGINDNVYADINGGINKQLDIGIGNNSPVKDSILPNINQANKAIRITFNASGLSDIYTGYRYAVIIADAGSGELHALSSPILSLQAGINNTFTYDGSSNGFTDIEVQDVFAINNIIHTAKHLEQLENRLIASNTTEQEFPLADYQVIASLIRSSVVLRNRQATLNTFNKIEAGKGLSSTYGTTTSEISNIKNQGSLQEGEVYAFGIIFCFGDYKTPVYHIPSPPSSESSSTGITSYSPDNTIYKNRHNKDNFWGQDGYGNSLLSQPVRFHQINLLNDNDIDKQIGITFSNINPPSGCTGYYIVRAVQNSEDKRVVDSGLLGHMMLRNNIHSFSTWNPIRTASNTDDNNIKYSDSYMWFFSPRHQFCQENPIFTHIIPRRVMVSNSQGNGGQTGSMVDGQINNNYDGHPNFSAGHVNIENVIDGTTYDPNIHDDSETDTDGQTLIVSWRYLGRIAGGDLRNDTLPISDITYLNPLEDTTNYRNASPDNRIGVCTMSTSSLGQGVYSALFINENTNIYQDYLNANYKVEHVNPVSVNEGDSGLSVTIYNGDVLNHSITLTNTHKIGTKSRHRDTRNDALLRIFGGAAAILGGALSSITGIGAGLGFTLIGGGVASIFSGFDILREGEQYEEEYAAGIRASDIRDVEHEALYNNINYSDDVFIIFAEILDAIIIQTDLPIGFRTQFNKRFFLPSGTTSLPSGITRHPDMGDRKNFDVHQVINFQSNFIGTRLGQYLVNKYTYPDASRTGDGLALSIPSSVELYHINLDYKELLSQESFQHLPLSYNSMSDCSHEFPTRIYYSEQSFQNNQDDLYSRFLANNFVDLESSGGEITAMRSLRNNLIVWTPTALWVYPQSVQRDITGEVSTYIGTGEYFAIPARAVSDDDASSSGCLDKYSILKIEGRLYYLDRINKRLMCYSGNNIEILSNNGLFNFFQENITNDTIYHSGYDRRYNRYLLTKEGSFTISYDITNKFFRSFHSYNPISYIYNNNIFMSVNNNNIHAHNITDTYQRFYGTLHPFIVEYVIAYNPVLSSRADVISIFSRARSINGNILPNYTFNKVIVYNDYESTGEYNLRVLDQSKPEEYNRDKDKNDEYDRTTNKLFVYIEFNEDNFNLNWILNFRDELNEPIFIKPTDNNNYIDKIPNPSATNHDVAYIDIGNIIGRYVVVRLIHDLGDEIELTHNHQLVKSRLSVRNVV